MSIRSRILPMVAALALATPVLPSPSAQAEPPQPTANAKVSVAGEQKTSGATLRYAPTGRSWQVVLTEPGSSYLKVHFASLKLAPGDRVTVADPTGREVHTYRGNPTTASFPGDSAHTVHGKRGFAAMSVDGDTAVVTLHAAKERPNAAALNRQGFGVHIDTYFRGFTETERAAANPQPLSVCGTDARKDVVCYQSSHPTEFARSGAVARQLLNGVGHCTAWRVGNTNRMLTNFHCMESAADLRASEFQFDYQCATCGGSNPRPGTKVSGLELIKSSPLSALDYALFSVNNFASIQPFGTLYLDVREPVAGERIYIPGHGDTKPKRLSLYEESDGGAYCKIDVVSSGVNTGYRCDSSGGNSGSPVLAGSSHKVIALHHLGGCPNWGTRISLVHREIASLIDNNDGGGGPGPGRRFENTADFPVNDLATVESPITVTEVAGNAPSALRVEVNIKHTYRGDVRLDLVGPNGTTYLLKDTSSDSADDIVATYTVNAGAQAANGTWKLRVHDAYRSDTGTLDSWALQF
ncbi:V8-like Glu-specific endopeptidase [Saccharothrix tamanrassetensis]|uniref:V8-like Glu-specific endopeptidase n=1 Tax=Saccharothrix tamanrassetensis TaxID=1051531 RepID=A0A841CQ70_9PSEU|nr:proprotein convertase P-domain-containing protein [Saccharothrix tamanrassetensis]MBB5957646.1 V8-like Glu-specific endopeptidase [Saccharothrix tamanrassetensis]